MNNQAAPWRLVCLVAAIILFGCAAVSAAFFPEPVPGRWYRAFLAGGLFFWSLSTITIT